MNTVSVTCEFYMKYRFKLYDAVAERLQNAFNLHFLAARLLSQTVKLALECL